MVLAPPLHVGHPQGSASEAALEHSVRTVWMWHGCQSGGSPDGDRCAGESVAVRDLTRLMMRRTGKAVATGVRD